MEPIQHLDVHPQADLLSKSGTDIETFFADAGLTVTVVSHCGDAACPRCFASNTAKAA